MTSVFNFAKGLFWTFATATAMVSCSKSDSDNISSNTPDSTTPLVEPYKSWPKKMQPKLNPKEKHFITFYVGADKGAYVGGTYSIGVGWADLNNNGLKDGEIEEITDDPNDYRDKSFEIDSPIITYYGNFYEFKTSSSANLYIEAIDVSHSPALEVFKINSNKVSSLDFSNNPKLSLVDISGNRILADAMLSMAKSLPQRKKEEQALIVLQNYMGVWKEHNQVSKDVLEELSKKNWKATYYSASHSEKAYNGNPDAPKGLNDYLGI